MGELKTVKRISNNSAAKLDMIPARDPVSINAMKQKAVSALAKAALRMRRFCSSGTVRRFATRALTMLQLGARSLYAAAQQV